MAELYVVTDHVYGEHPQVPGAQVLIAAPGQAIPLEQAVELGLVKARGRAAKAESEGTGEPEGAGDPEGGHQDPEPNIVTAENRRAPRARAKPRNA